MALTQFGMPAGAGAGYAGPAASVPMDTMVGPVPDKAIQNNAINKAWSAWQQQPFPSSTSNWYDDFLKEQEIKDAMFDYNQQNDLYNLQSSFLGPNRQNALAMLGLDRERLGLSRAGIGIDEGEIRRDFETKLRGINSDFTSRGAWFAPEKGAQIEDSEAARDADLARKQLERQGLAIDERGIGLREQGVNLGFDQKLAELGLSKSQLKAKLDNALNKLNLNSYFTGQDIMDGLNSNAAAQWEWLIKQLGIGW